MNKDELDCLKDFSVFTHNTLSTLSNRECRERERERLLENQDQVVRMSRMDLIELIIVLLHRVASPHRCGRRGRRHVARPLHHHNRR
jgi:hypothetical protein